MTNNGALDMASPHTIKTKFERWLAENPLNSDFGNGAEDLAYEAFAAGYHAAGVLPQRGTDMTETITVTLTTPIEGYEPVAEYKHPVVGDMRLSPGGKLHECLASGVGSPCQCLVLTPLPTHKYNWGMTGFGVLVVDAEKRLYRLESFAPLSHPFSLELDKGWQAPPRQCEGSPVDPTACIVEVEYGDGSTTTDLCEGVAWPRVRRWRFVELVKGVIW